MKEVTTIITAQITCINKVKDDENIGVIEKKIAEEIKERLGVDDAVVTKVQTFERDIQEAKKPKITFSSNEQMEEFFKNIAWATCPSVIGMPVSVECDHTLGNGPICTGCWKDVFDWEVVENDKD